MKSETIKPCPFCGSKGAIYIWGMSIYWTACCTGDNLKEGERCDCGWNNWFKTKKEAVKRWNTRSYE